MITKPSKHHNIIVSRKKYNWGKYEAVRISPKAKKKLQQICKDNGITMIKGLDRLLNIEGAFTNKEIYQDQVDKVRKEEFYQQSLDEIRQSVKKILSDDIQTQDS